MQSMALRKTADLFSCRGRREKAQGGQSGLASGHLSKGVGLLCRTAASGSLHLLFLLHGLFLPGTSFPTEWA